MITIVKIIAIALALFSTVAVILAMRYYRIAENLRQKNKDLRESIDGYIEAEENCNAFYVVRRIKKLESEYFGLWAVCRTVVAKDGVRYNSCIRVFFYNDDGFNKREADKLCEILNSK